MTDKIVSILSEYSHCSNTKLYKILNHIASHPSVYDINCVDFNWYNMELITTRTSISYTNRDMVKIHYGFADRDKNIYDHLKDLFIVISKMISQDTLYKLEGDKLFTIDNSSSYMYVEDILCKICLIADFDENEVNEVNKERTTNYYEIYGNKFNEDVYYSLLQCFENKELEEIFYFLGNKRKLLCLAKKGDFKLYYSESGLEKNHSHDHYNDRMLYLDCMGCFKYYKKLLDLFDEFNVEEFEIKFSSIHINLAKKEVSENDDSFVQHICKGNNLYNLLNLIEKEYNLPISKEEIVKILTYNRVKNAKSSIQ